MRALIVGVNGQDGSYLAELLLSKGYEIHGTVRRSSLPNLQRIEHIRDRITLHWADLSDSSSLHDAVRQSMPDEVYNLGAMSDVRVSFDVPEYCSNVTGLGAVRLLEAVRQVKPDARFYQAGSSEMHGNNPDVPCNEESAFYPASPYAAAKVYAHNITRNYREAYGMFAVSGILYNHESERRGVEFVTRKITLGLSDILTGKSDCIELGNIHAARDWGHARDYVRAMYLMMTAPEPDDYVVATGEAHTVVEFLTEAFDYVGLDWRGHVAINTDLCRPSDPPLLLGDAAKAHQALGWKPEVGFSELVGLMVEADL